MDTLLARDCLSVPASGEHVKGHTLVLNISINQYEVPDIRARNEPIEEPFHNLMEAAKKGFF